MLTQERLKELLNYDPETGVFRWRASGSGRSKDLSAGHYQKNGYCRICIDKIHYHAHRLAWLYMTGCFPVEDIDHINRNTSDNRFFNLRAASRFQNCANMKTKRNGLKGCFLDKRDGRWYSLIRINGRRIYLGSFKTELEAHRAYVSAAISGHGEFARAA